MASLLAAASGRNVLSGVARTAHLVVPGTVSARTLSENSSVLPRFFVSALVPTPGKNKTQVFA